MTLKTFEVVMHVSLIVHADSRLQAEEVGWGLAVEHPQTGEIVYPDYVDSGEVFVTLTAWEQMLKQRQGK